VINDILSQAVVDLEYYLNNPNFDGTYSRELRERIIRLRDEAEYIRVVLDTHPCDTPPSQAVLRDRIATDRREAREGFAASNGFDLTVFDNKIRCQEIRAEDEPSR
jgi:hypothetical protein